MMNSRILFYAGLCLIWLALTIAILLGYHERFLGQAEDWKKFLALGICVLMILFNLLRIYRVRNADQRFRKTHDQS